MTFMSTPHHRSGQMPFRRCAAAGKWSFQVAPQAPEASQIRETVDCEAVVVGAGLGGLTAACRLKEQGVDVVLIEKSASYSGRGGHFGVPDSSLMEAKGVRNDLKALARQWIAISGNNIDQELLWTFLRRSREAMDWLLPKAEASGLTPKLVDCVYPTAPYKEFYGAHSFPPTGNIRGSYVSKALYEHAQKLGVPVRFHCPAVQLIQDGAGRVVGLYAQDREGLVRFNARLGVVLATGDIGGDQEMCKAYAPDALRTQASQYVPAGCNTGDGHKMGLWAGGVMAEEVFPIMMHPQHFSWCSLFFLFVNKDGKRFMNEDTYVQGRATSIMREKDGMCYSILAGDFADHMEESLKYGGGIFWGNAALAYGTQWTKDQVQASVQRAIDTGMAVKADTLEELADQMDVDKDAFLRTVAEYNGFCRDKDDRQFGKREELLFPLEKGPFVAMKLGTALLEVVGGLAINTKMQVLNKARRPIPGVYAVGDTTGGMYGHEYVTTILGNSHGRALTWGYLAAEDIAASKA